MNRLLLVLVVMSAGCVFSPEGENEERDRAERARPGEAERPLPSDAPLDAILRHAYLANAGLKQKWWAWKAALEQIPQDASQPGVALTYEQMFENGNTSWSQATFGLVTDPMANWVWPGKLKTAGRRALDTARAAGFRFEAARLELRARVITEWMDYALLSETIRTREADAEFLRTTVELTDARVRAGAASQQDLIQARTRRDLARNLLERERERIPGRRARLNALLNRDPGAALDLPRRLPAPRTLDASDADILARLSERNPELAALAAEAKGRREAVTLMRQQYLPDFALGFSGDGGGVTRTIMGMLTAPFVRYAAIEASIAQAKAELEMTRAMRRQMEHDLKARAVLLLYDFRSAGRQSAVYETSILPQAEMAVEAARAAYAAGRVPAAELVDAQRMRLEINLMVAELRAEREKTLADLEALVTGAS